MGFISQTLLNRWKLFLTKNLKIVITTIFITLVRQPIPKEINDLVRGNLKCWPLIAFGPLPAIIGNM